nr:hypothetical protein StreXyl84_04360 [Streptomyces sp. Xyl84]
MGSKGEWGVGSWSGGPTDRKVSYQRLEQVGTRRARIRRNERGMHWGSSREEETGGCRVQDRDCSAQMTFPVGV